MTDRKPLRRLAEKVVLTSMRPPRLPTLLRYRRNHETVELKGKRILLTGASSGIGEAAAAKLADCGATVIVVARRQDLLDALVTRIAQAGGDARAHACDLSDLDAVDDLVATVEAELGGVDILVNNAGR
nr:SDR family NAD(P)-dependent oxidoreductase [Actinomycetes bacterium]